MSIWRAARTVYALTAVVALATAACNPSGGPQTGGLTNWLTACQVDADCGDLQCLCGACTRSCDAEASCADLANSSCVAADDVGAIALCGGDEPSSSLCLPRCEEEEEACTFGTMCVAGVCGPVPEPTVQVEIDSTSRYQRLVGLGASLAYSEDEIAGHPLVSELYDAMFTESGIDAVRLRNRYQGDNPEDLSAASEILGAAADHLGGPPTIFMTSGSPPASLKANGSRGCAGNVDTCTLAQLADGSFDYPGFAAHWRASLEAHADLGIFPDYINIQNNPNWVPPESDPNEACKFLPTEGTETVRVDGARVEVAYPGFAQALEAVLAELDGLETIPQIAAPEVSSFEFVPEYAPHLDSADVDAIAVHMYGTDPTDIDVAALEELGELAQEYDRPVFQTEMRSDGFGTAVLMHHVLTAASAAVYLQNDFVSSSAALGQDPMAMIALDTDAFTLKEPYHAMRHFAFYTDPDWVRVGASSDNEDLLASAWLSPDEDALTVVLVNAGLAALVVRLELGDELSDWVADSEVTRTTFEGLERSTELGALSAEGILRVPGHSIVTVALPQ